MARSKRSHQVNNANKRLARLATSSGSGAGFRPQVNLSTVHQDDVDVYELDGRLTLVQERTVQWKVPAQDLDVDYDLEQINNPVNQVGPLHAFEVPIVTNNDPVSYRAAVNKRSNFIQADDEDDIEDAPFKLARDIIARQPRLFGMWEENDEDRERWLSKFGAGKRARMEQAWLELDPTDLKELRKKTGSVKREVLIGKRFDKEAAGRIIYAGSDAFNAVTGPAHMVCMERLVHLLASTDSAGRPNKVGSVEVLLGYKATDRSLAEFIRDDRYPEIVEGDFSRNDREQRSRVATLCDDWFDVVGMPPWFRALLFQLEEYTLVNYDFGLRVNLKYQLATGTTNTTFRNSIYNMTMFAVCAGRQHRQGKALVLGDDLLACLDRRLDLKAWVRDVGEFKMVLKAKSPVLNGEATFLSRRFCYNTATPFMLPCPEKAYFRFNCRANANQAMTDDQYVCSKALSYAFGFRHVHKLRDLFLRRFEMNGAHEDFDIEEIGWNNRQFGFSVEDILKRTRESENLVTDEDFAEWVADVYEQSIDLVEFEALFEEMVCSNERVIIDNPLAEAFLNKLG